MCDLNYLLRRAGASGLAAGDVLEIPHGGVATISAGTLKITLQAADITGAATFDVAFTHNHGDLKPMTAAITPTGAGQSIAVTDDQVRGTKEEAECSNRGVCDKKSGRCKCFPGYCSSDGAGSSGPYVTEGKRNMAYHQNRVLSHANITNNNDCICHVLSRGQKRPVVVVAVCTSDVCSPRLRWAPAPSSLA